MTKTQLKEKVNDMEIKLKLLKRMVSEKPDFELDEKNWNKIKSDVKKIRGMIYKKNYDKS